MMISGIITTNLGKTATFARGAGRERRVHHSKSLPLLLTGERFFLFSFRRHDFNSSLSVTLWNGYLKRVSDIHALCSSAAHETGVKPDPGIFCGPPVARPMPINDVGKIPGHEARLVPVVAKKQHFLIDIAIAASPSLSRRVFPS